MKCWFISDPPGSIFIEATLLMWFPKFTRCYFKFFKEVEQKQVILTSGKSEIHLKGKMQIISTVEVQEISRAIHNKIIKTIN